MSLPVWERGLKYGAQDRKTFLTMSLPVWERGLKFRNIHLVNEPPVAPRVGAWIEMIPKLSEGLFEAGRSPCGSMD